MVYLITIGLAVLIGAISAVAAWSVTRGFQKKQPAFSILLVLFFLILGICSKLFALPNILEWKSSGDINRALSQISVYQHIAKYDPKAYQEIKREITASIKNRETQDEVIGRARKRVADLVAGYIPLASDDAILRYMKAMVKEMEELAGKNPELCYQFLFPQKYGAVDVTEHLTPETQREDLVALAEVIRTAVEQPQPPPGPCGCRNASEENPESILPGLWRRYSASQGPLCPWDRQRKGLQSYRIIISGSPQTARKRI